MAYHLVVPAVTFAAPATLAGAIVLYIKAHGLSILFHVALAIVKAKFLGRDWVSMAASEGVSQAVIDLVKDMIGS